MAQISQSSLRRVKRFVDSFIRSEDVQNLTADRDNQGYGSRAERFARVQDAAEHGADGKLHAEVIGDWREAFRLYIDAERKKNRRDSRTGEVRPGWYGSEWERFQTAVEAEFSRIEQFYADAGTLFQEIG
jgi:predicted secreted protein